MPRIIREIVMQADPDPEVMCFGVYLEPSAAFLAEIGASVWQP